MYQVKFVYPPSTDEKIKNILLEDKINSVLTNELIDKKIINISLSPITGLTTSEQVAVILYEVN